MQSRRNGGRNLEDSANEAAHAENLRNLQTADNIGSINYHTMGATGPVKDQGACGSCYAFAANTVLEAMAW